MLKRRSAIKTVFHWLPIIFLALSMTACSKKFQPFFERAQKAFDEQKYVECIDAVHLALPRWRDNDGKEARAKAYELLGKSYHKLSKIDSAANAFAEAIKLSDNTYDSAYQLGIIYLASNQNELALKAFRDALRMRNDDPKALVGLGNAYYELNLYENAKQAYSRVLDTSPGVAEAIKFITLIEQKQERAIRPASPKAVIRTRPRRR